ncbi:MAG: hypothetical protein ACLFUH_04030 [Bacteroidales bacterium]
MGITSTLKETVAPAIEGAKVQFKAGYHLGKKKGFTSGIGIAGLFSGLIMLLIFSYVASDLGPTIIENFKNNSIEGVEGNLFSLGGVIAAAGILAGVGAMVGLEIME